LRLDTLRTEGGCGAPPPSIRRGTDKIARRGRRTPAAVNGFLRIGAERTLHFNPSGVLVRKLRRYDCLGRGTEGALAIWRFQEIYRDVMSNEVRTFLIRQQMKMTFTHIRDTAGRDNLPVRAVFALPEDGQSREDERELSCPCLYGDEVNELHYPVGILDQTPELGNRLTRAMLEETCERLIGQSRIASGLSGEVYQLLLRAPNQSTSMTSIAEQLGLQERTLRRRLAAEDTSYGEIVDDVRRKLAIEYLETTRMSVDDVAWKVGFSDSANLRRAVRRWTGKTISEVRARK